MFYVGTHTHVLQMTYDALLQSVVHYATKERFYLLYCVCEKCYIQWSVVTEHYFQEIEMKL